MVLKTDYYNNLLEYAGSSSLKGHLPSDIDIYTFKTDYVHPFKGGRLEVGLKFSYVKNDNEVTYGSILQDDS